VPLPPPPLADQTRTEEPEQRGRVRDGAKDPALHLDHFGRVLMVRPAGRAAAIFQQQTFEPPITMLQRGSISTFLSPARLRLRNCGALARSPDLACRLPSVAVAAAKRDSASRSPKKSRSSDDPDAILPVTRSIVERGRHYSALDAYRAQYELAQLKREADVAFRSIDVLLLPTTGTIYEKAAVAADPFRLNANLGLYTNFVNLLDLTAIAVPGGFRKNGLPFGISLIAPAFAERALLDLTARFYA